MINWSVCPKSIQVSRVRARYSSAVPAAGVLVSIIGSLDENLLKKNRARYRVGVECGGWNVE